eukprot:gene10513-7301_t
MQRLVSQSLNADAESCVPSRVTRRGATNPGASPEKRLGAMRSFTLSRVPSHRPLRVSMRDLDDRGSLSGFHGPAAQSSRGSSHGGPWSMGFNAKDSVRHSRETHGRLSSLPDELFFPTSSQAAAVFSGPLAVEDTASHMQPEVEDLVSQSILSFGLGFGSDELSGESSASAASSQWLQGRAAPGKGGSDILYGVSWRREDFAGAVHVAPVVVVAPNPAGSSAMPQERLSENAQVQRRERSLMGFPML